MPQISIVSILFSIRILRKWNKYGENGMKKLCKISYRVQILEINVEDLQINYSLQNSWLSQLKSNDTTQQQK